MVIKAAVPLDKYQVEADLQSTNIIVSQDDVIINIHGRKKFVKKCKLIWRRRIIVICFNSSHKQRQG